MPRNKTLAVAGPLTFVERAALAAVEDALKLTAKNAANGMTAVIVVPHFSDAEFYETAVERHFVDFISGVLCQKRTSIAHVVSKDALTSMTAYGSYDFSAMIVADENLLTPQVRLVSDRILKLRSPQPSDFIPPSALAGRGALAEKDAALCASMPLSIVAMAFGKRRSVSAAMRKLRTYARQQLGAGQPNNASANDERTLHELPGYGEAKSWGLRLAHDLNDWRNGKIRWRDVDKGVVLSGPPGVGKTVFARALALTCDVHLVHASAAQWQAQGHLGDLLKAMAGSFDEARRLAPSVLFIDELDGVGSRDEPAGDNALYIREKVNGFLEKLDGIEGRDGVVVIGATNRIENVDPAILRSGRLERVIEIELPDVEARNAILRLNLPDLPRGRSEKFEEISDGWNGADVERLARDVAREARTSGEELSIALVERMLPHAVELGASDRERIAIHEAGHALLAYFVEGTVAQSIGVQRYVPGGSTASGSGGSVVVGNDPSRVRTRRWYEQRIAVLLGGMAAEQLLLGEFGDGAGGSETSDLAMANYFAACIVLVFGMGRDWVSVPTFDAEILRRMVSLNATSRAAVHEIIDTQFSRAHEVLKSNQDLLRRLSDGLIAKGRLDASELQALLSLTLKPGAEERRQSR